MKTPISIISVGKPIALMDFIAEIERALGKKATCSLQGMQAGDMTHTWADTRALERDYGYRPQTSLREGVEAFVAWYRAYYGDAS